MKKCPNCGSDRLYRENPTSLIIHCENCKADHKARKSLKPLHTESVKIKRTRYKITVWHCPVDQDLYSFAAACGGVCLMNEFEEDPYLKGKYESINHAVYAAKEWLKE